MGLGKTIMTIALLAHLAIERPGRKAAAKAWGPDTVGSVSHPEATPGQSCSCTDAVAIFGRVPLFLGWEALPTFTSCHGSDPWMV